MDNIGRLNEMLGEELPDVNSINSSDSPLSKNLSVMNCMIPNNIVLADQTVDNFAISADFRYPLASHMSPHLSHLNCEALPQALQTAARFGPDPVGTHLLAEENTHGENLQVIYNSLLNPRITYVRQPNANFVATNLPLKAEPLIAADQKQGNRNRERAALRRQKIAEREKYLESRVRELEQEIAALKHRNAELNALV